MPLLPNELVDSIIEELYNDHYALNNCALVARAWVRASQRGIFRFILLDLSRSSFAPRLTLLISLLDANPRLATYVKSLILMGDYSESPEDWEEGMVGVVNRLSELDEISFCDFDWSAISPYLKEILLRLLRRSLLTKATFLDFDIGPLVDFTSLLISLTHLKSLRIGCVHHNWYLPDSASDSVATHPLPPPRSVQLVDLDLRGSDGQLLVWLQRDSCSIDIQNLRTLRLGNDGMATYYERAASIIRCAGTSLQQLDLEGPEVDQQNTDAVHVGLAPNLRRLELLDLKQSASYTPIPWIESLFKPVVHSNQRHYPLQSLTIHISVSHRPGDPLHYWDQWTAVDRILEEKIFAALEKVSIVFGHSSLTSNITEEKEEEIGKSLCEVLPFLADSGKLRYHFLA